MTELLGLAALGGALALDATSVGQFMVSRPLVAGALTGWVLGDPATGILVGALLELYLLVAFPTGGARFPEGATATVVAVAAATAAPGPGAVPVAVAAGLLWGQVGGWSITRHREAIARFVPEPSSRSVHAGRVAVAHLGAIGLDFVRGALVTASGVVLARLAVEATAEPWPLAPEASRGLLLVGGAVSAGILLRSLGGVRKRGLLFLAGLVLGLAGATFL
ncbi:MAG: PTS sugar transporter subunit IIC [Longimicrobiales bacterium]